MESQEAKSPVELIIRSLLDRGVRAAPIQEAMSLASANPEAVEALAVASIERFPKGGTFLDATLSYLPENRWDALVRFALDALERQGENEAACSVIAYASLQASPSLHPHLDRIFRLRPNDRSYYENYPWRESGTSHFRFLCGAVEQRRSEPERSDRAWRSLLQTRHPDVLAYALNNVEAVRATSPGLSIAETIQAHLHLVGYHQNDLKLRKLCSESQFHLIFPESYFEGESRPQWLARVHPTWTADSRLETLPIWFGGLVDGECSLCGDRLHRLIELGPIPSGLGVTKIPRIELATCLSCLGWERQPLFYRHDQTGRPEDIGYQVVKVQPRFPVGPLKETGAHIAVTPHRWRWQDWALSNSRENLTRLGGEPSWVQDAEYPNCPDCGETMRHLHQLDSDLPTADGDEWQWGSGGIAYVSWCDDCKVSGVLWQCT